MWLMSLISIIKHVLGLAQIPYIMAQLKVQIMDPIIYLKYLIIDEDYKTSSLIYWIFSPVSIRNNTRYSGGGGEKKIKL